MRQEFRMPRSASPAARRPPPARGAGALLALAELLIASLALVASFGAAPAVAATPTTHAFVTQPAEPWHADALAAEIARWKKDAGVSRVLVLDARVPPPGSDEAPGFSTLVLLDFADEAAFARWRATARAPEGTTVRQADAVVHGEAPDRDLTSATYEVNVYRLTTTSAEYRRFSEGYIVPLMDGQRDHALLAWYTMYVERAPVGEANSVLVKEYRSDATYTAAATFKPLLRARLAAEHPTYPRYHEIKETLRKNVSETVAKVRP
jgi:hypothetical protein